MIWLCLKTDLRHACGYWSQACQILPQSCLTFSWNLHASKEIQMKYLAKVDAMIAISCSPTCSSASIPETDRRKHCDRNWSMFTWVTRDQPLPESKFVGLESKFASGHGLETCASCILRNARSWTGCTSNRRELRLVSDFNWFLKSFSLLLSGMLSCE